MTTVLTLAAMAYGGDTVARLPSGQVVFVSGGLPGESVEVDLLPARGGVARGRVIAVQRPSPDRTTPPCPYFGPCGGCQWQHATYPAQLAFKQEILADVLGRQARLEQVPLEAPVPSPDPWNYRYSAQFHVTWDGQLGYLRGRSHEVLPVSTCPISHPAIITALDALQNIVSTATAEAEAGLREVAIRVADDGPMTELLLVLYGPEEAQPLAERVALAFATRHEHVRGCWFVSTATGRAQAERRQLLVGRATLRQRVGDLRFRIGPTVFFQANPLQAEALQRVVHGYVAAARPRRLLDLFCGVGLLALSLADIAEVVSGADTNEDAIDLANESAMENGIGKARFLAASAEEALRLHSGPDAVVLDPPRTGCTRGLLDELLNRRPATIVYVSCDPMTLARDIVTLRAGGYALRSVRLVDLFPQSFHIESVALLTAR